MKRGSLLAVCLLMGCIGRIFANETASTEVTTVVIYRVGDIVSSPALEAPAFIGGRSTLPEWGSEYSETIAALTELQGLLESLHAHPSMRVAVFRPGLSMIVRHTESGHRDIEQFLAALRQDETLSLRLEFYAIAEEPSNSLKAILTADQLSHLEGSMAVPILSESQTAEFQSLMVKNSAKSAFVVDLKPGRRTAWGSPLRPCTAMGRMDAESGMAQIRLDFISEDIGETVPFGVQCVTLRPGQATLFYQLCDGGLTTWLMTVAIPSQPDPTVQNSRVAREIQ